MTRREHLATLRRGLILLGLAIALLLPGRAFTADSDEGARWYKGNIHAHSLWSDGRAFPETVVDWYKSRGFDFFALSDHNILQEGERWVPVEPKRRRGVPDRETYESYKAQFGSDWIDEKTSGSTTLVRLKTLEEYRGRYEEPGKFLLIPAIEINGPKPAGTDYRVHVNAVNVAGVIPGPGDGKDQESPGAWQANEMGRSIAAHAAEHNIPVHGHLNHPLWSYLTAEDVSRITTLNRMEINNDDSGSSETLPRTEALWDTVLAHRIAHDMPLMLVTAVDDAHNHVGDLPFSAGHGWIMVRAHELTVEAIIGALDAGDFYATRGPLFSTIDYGRDRMSLKIEPQEGVTFRTEFIGQRPGGEPGEVFATVDGLNPSYSVTGNEIYLRAKVTSSKVRKTPEGKPAYHEMAWTQPYEPLKAKAN